MIACVSDTGTHVAVTPEPKFRGGWQQNNKVGWGEGGGLLTTIVNAVASAGEREGASGEKKKKKKNCIRQYRHDLASHFCLARE